MAAPSANVRFDLNRDVVVIIVCHRRNRSEHNGVGRNAKGQYLSGTILILRCGNVMTPRVVINKHGVLFSPLPTDGNLT